MQTRCSWCLFSPVFKIAIENSERKKNTILSKKMSIEQKRSRYTNRNKQQTSRNNNRFHLSHAYQTHQYLPAEITIDFIYHMHIKHPSTCASYV